MKKINKKAVKYARSIHKHLPYPLPIGENDLIKAYIAGAVDFNGEVQDGPDWEQRRYELAKELFSARVESTYKSLSTSDILMERNSVKFVEHCFENIAKSCVLLSDMLIKQLQGE